MAPSVLFVVNPTIVPECKACIDLAEQCGVQVRELEPDKIASIRERFGDDFTGVPALWSDKKFILGSDAEAALRQQAGGGALEGGQSPPSAQGAQAEMLLCDDIPPEEARVSGQGPA